jgi:hypothetical protein
MSDIKNINRYEDCSDSEDDAHNTCDECGNHSDDVFVHAWGCFGMCEECTEKADEPHCPREHVDECEVCCEAWKEYDEKHLVELVDMDEIYNSSNDKPGVPREYAGQPGTFYQTYGNGGGKNGWGGYWVRDGGKAVWNVEGQEFTYMNNHWLHVKDSKCLLFKFVTG